MALRIVVLLWFLCGLAVAAPQDEQAERALAGSLRYLGANQQTDGSWTLRNGGSPVGMTSYAVLAFLASGNSRQHGLYAQTVARGIDYLAASVRPDGSIFREAFGQFPDNLYDQGSATFALSEACVITHDDSLRPKVARAAGFIMSCQDESGGWKFKPVAAERPDLPVTALQLSALCAARTVGADVPQTTIDRGVEFILRCRDDATGGFAYTPRGSNPGPSRTASALYALELCGRDNRAAAAHASAYLFQNPTPAVRDEQGLWFAYGRYYAAAAQYLRGSDTWDHWYPAVRAELVRTAHHDRGLVWWEDDTSNPPDPIYITALNATILALPHGRLPLYATRNHEKS